VIVSYDNPDLFFFHKMQYCLLPINHVTFAARINESDTGQATEKSNLVPAR